MWSHPRRRCRSVSVSALQSGLCRVRVCVLRRRGGHCRRCAHRRRGGCRPVSISRPRVGRRRLRRRCWSIPRRGDHCRGEQLARWVGSSGRPLWRKLISFLISSWQNSTFDLAFLNCWRGRGRTGAGAGLRRGAACGQRRLVEWKVNELSIQQGGYRRYLICDSAGTDSAPSVLQEGPD